MDLQQLFGPGYAGYLYGRDSAKANEMQALQGMGMLSQMQRQAEQSKLLEQELALKKLAEEREAMKLRFGQSLFGGQGAANPAQQALAQGAAQGDVGPTESNAQRLGMLQQQAPQGGAGVLGWSPDQIVGAGFMGLAKPQDIMAVRTGFLPKYDVQNGAIIGGRPGEVPQFAGFVPQAKMADNGQASMLVPTPDGGVRSVIPQGALENYAAFKGVDARAQMGNPLAVSAEQRALAEARDKGIPVPDLPTAPLTAPVPAPAPSASPVNPNLAEALAVEQSMLERANKSGDINGSARARANIAAIEREINQQASRSGVSTPAPSAQSGLAISPEQRRKLELERPQATLALENTTAALSSLKEAAERIKDMKGFAGNFGMSGMIFNRPGGDAANAAAELNTLRTQIAFAALQAMRDASKSGGALGAISDRENDMLQNAWASFEKAQNAEQAKKSLEEVARRSDAAIGRLQRAYEMTYGKAPAVGGASGGWGGGEFRVLNVRPAQ